MDINKHKIGAYLKASGKAQNEPGLIKEAKKVDRATAPKKATTQSENLQFTVKKDPRPSPSQGEKPSRVEIAKYLILIGTEEAVKILNHLGEKEAEALAKEIGTISRIDKEEADRILDKFQGFVKTGPNLGSHGGSETAKRFLEAAFGAERGGQIFRQALPNAEEPFFSYLKDMDAPQILGYLRPEAPHIKALVLAHLQPQTAANIIKSMPGVEQKEVILRLATMRGIERDVIVRVDKALRERVKDAASAANELLDGRASLANIIRFMDSELEQGILDELAFQAPDLAQDIRDRLFTIDTVLLVDDRDLQRVLSPMEDKQIALILKGKDEVIKNKLLRNVSETRAATILDEYDLLGRQLKRDVEVITRDFINHLKVLETDGEIRVIRDDDEEYV